MIKKQYLPRSYLETKEASCKRRKKPFKKKLYIFFGILIFIILLIIFVFEFFINPVIINVSESKIKSMTNFALNKAVRENTEGSLIYEDLVDIKLDSKGDISLIQTNGIEINRFSQKLLLAATENVKEVGGQGFEIPIGNFTRMPVFTGRGPSVTIKMVQVGNTDCNVYSEFTSCGINQTKHKIYVVFGASMSLILPGKQQKLRQEVNVVICETIIVGKVPEVYLNSEPTKLT